MKFIFLSLLFLAFTVSPLTAQTKEEKKKMKEEKAEEAYAASIELIDSGSYTFTADWASTQNGTRINLISNPNYFKIKNGEADIDLPYFGVVQTPSAGSGDGGIVFKGAVEDYKVTLNDKKQKISVKFKARGKTDFFTFNLTVYKNSNAVLTVLSNSRNSINFDGKVVATEL